MYHSFKFTERDAAGCTNISKKVFSDTLGLTHKQSVKLRRVTGEIGFVDVIRCTSAGRKFYQLDLSTAFDIGIGARVKLIPKAQKKNEVTMIVVEPPQNMWGKRGVVDAIVDLQNRLDELEHDVYEEDDDDDQNQEEEHDAPTHHVFNF